MPTLKTSEGVRDAFLLIFLSCTYALVKGSTYVTGIFFLQYQIHLGASASQASLAVGLSTASNFLGGPIYGTLYSLLGFKRSCVISSILTGLGYILISLSGSITVVQLLMAIFIGPGVGINQIAILSVVGGAFTAKRAFANSVISAAGNVIALLLGPLVQGFVDSYSWRWSLRLLGAIVLNGIPTSLLSDWFLVSDKEAEVTIESLSSSEIELGRPDCEMEKLSDAQESEHKKSQCARASSLIDFTLLLDPTFVCYLISMSAYILSSFCPVFYLIRYAQDVGIDDTSAVWMLSLVYALYTIGCPIFGLATSYCRGDTYDEDTRRMSDTDQDKEELDTKNLEQKEHYCRTFISRIRRSYVLGILELLVAITLIIPLLSESYSGFMTYAILSGLFIGFVGMLPMTVLGDLFGVKKLPSTLSFRALFSGIVILSVPSFIGYLIDEYDNYRPAQYVCCGMAVLSGITTFLTQISMNRRH